MNTKQLIDGLADLYAQRDYLASKKKELIDQVTPDEVKVKIAEIEAEFADKQEAVNKQIAAVEEEAKQIIKDEHKKTVKGEYYQGVYSKPRVTWKTKILDDLPELIEKMVDEIVIDVNTAETRLLPKTTVVSKIYAFKVLIIDKIKSARNVGDASVSFRVVGK